jgi:FtsP/CotA-like multicopper oxidase with cupredoxin domain
MTSRNVRLGTIAGLGCALLLLAGRVPAQPQSPTPAPALPPCLQTEKPLLEPPEITSGTTGKLRAILKNVDGVRTIWGNDRDNRCAPQHMRFFTGSNPAHPRPWPATADPIPGPTFRAKLGDLVEITFFNEVDPSNFPFSLDRGTVGTAEACDQYTTPTGSPPPSSPVPVSPGPIPSPISSTGSAGGDTMPDCLHGSSTTNVHFHGTHTTPSTTGDNILLFIRPALRKNGLHPSESQTNRILAKFFTSCELNGPPKRWTQMPVEWQKYQQALVHEYDSTFPYQGKPGTLPPGMQLGVVDAQQIKMGLWPQYQLGANPYCFRLPKYVAGGPYHMGQAPGTHWYHAHKHGSTALNVANGMSGVLIIEGPYDQQLHSYYHAGLRERVLMIQQLSTSPFPLITNVFDPNGPPGAPRPRISVNGRLDPLVAMRPGEIQMWRIVNADFRDALQFVSFPTKSGTPCANPSAVVGPRVDWRQIAQDGVQFNVANYDTFGARNHAFNLASANRADLLVKAPTAPGKYTMCVRRNIGLQVQSGVPSAPEPPTVLLTVQVAGPPVSPAVDFIPNNDPRYPTFPAFLSDIRPSEIKRKRTIVFGSNHKFIDGQPFIDGRISQQMQLNTAEEWIIENQANDKSHPFHIHINPFQILEVFEPNNPAQPCPVNPNDPTTFDPSLSNFKPCPKRALPAPWIWWDTFPIPAGEQITLPSSNCTVKPTDCKPAAIQPYVQCGQGSCTETIPGWFRERSRFVDFTGQYVLHCHILIHEDRGMMQLVEVTAGPPVPHKSPYSHH